jgi:hypothetical protein
VLSRTELQVPYSLLLSDYSRPGATRLALNLLLQDNSIANYAVRLRLVIEGNNITIRSRPDFRPPPIFLNGGINERFLGSDLEAYFRSENLIFQGLSRTAFERNGGRLPEGFYRIYFEVLDFNRDIVLSTPSQGTASAWLLLNDPPLLNLPAQEAKVQPLPQQNLVFSWTARHSASPNAARNVEYRFSLVQLVPQNRNPNDAILSSLPIYQTTTRSTQLVYGIAEPALELGARYAWRVQAVEAEGLDLFKNQGFSEVYAFTYGSPCAAPLSAQAEVLNALRARISWQGGAGNTNFRVFYRKKGSSQWASSPLTPLSFALLDDLEAGTAYEYQVRGYCGELAEVPGTRGSFITPEIVLQNLVCGAPQGPVDLTEQTPKENLRVGDTLQAADFEVRITKVAASGAAGRYSGEGLMVFPLANQAKVKLVFENIFVNSANRFIEGKLVVQGMGVQVLSDELISSLTGLLSEVDALLGQAETSLEQLEDILGKLEQALELMMRYLPDDLLQEIRSTQTALQEAKTNLEQVLSNPDASPEQKAQARAQVREAKGALRNAYGNAASYWAGALADMARILWTTLLELSQEAIVKIKGSQEDFRNAQREIKALINGDTQENASGFEELVLEDVSLVQKTASPTFLTEVPEEAKPLVALTQKHAQAAIDYRVYEFINILKDSYGIDDMNTLGEDLQSFGLDILDFILSSLKQGKKPEEIIVQNKIKIKLLIINLLLEKINEP